MRALSFKYVKSVCGGLQSVEPWQLHKKANLGAPHTTHCLGSGEVLISCMGDENEEGKGKIYTSIYHSYNGTLLSSIGLSS